jgi:hypothetical protein
MALTWLIVWLIRRMNELGKSRRQGLSLRRFGVDGILLLGLAVVLLLSLGLALDVLMLIGWAVGR